jgi:hypothetical protein
MNRQNIRMFQLGDQPGFLLEARQEFFSLCKPMG